MQATHNQPGAALTNMLWCDLNLRAAGGNVRSVVLHLLTLHGAARLLCVNPQLQGQASSSPLVQFFYLYVQSALEEALA